MDNPTQPPSAPLRFANSFQSMNAGGPPRCISKTFPPNGREAEITQSPLTGPAKRGSWLVGLSEKLIVLYISDNGVAQALHADSRFLRGRIWWRKARWCARSARLRPAGRNHSCGSRHDHNLCRLHHGGYRLHAGNIIAGQRTARDDAAQNIAPAGSPIPGVRSRSSACDPLHQAHGRGSTHIRVRWWHICWKER